ncbi:MULTISPECIES: glycosyltransferase family 2 protein [unclassified Streptomyces]|uniref:glycosyltransferase family 2 protein n=1 Tax=unclassified Streptomyces TaxID=2593676 RepID=UPI000CD4B514|nr:glycosyltransferase family 2 protein [Streptomyces sp. SM10]
MSVKVSVVIPVYNPGEYIEDCISALLRQSLPEDEYEAIFVDDGSTDATPARLDEIAAAHPNIHVVHQESSGWSGKPRNVGTALAKGEFVMYVDNDDWLGDEALERMYRYGVENGADVVIGKMAGKGRPVPVELFRINRPRASVSDAPLMDSLTPHKMFRREFLESNNITFREGRRRLEDHVFVVETYLRAANISVLSDYLCYYHIKREDASNAGFQRFDPVGYYGNLREALDIVEKYTEPGALRDSLFRRWLRNEMVERLRGKRLLNLPEDYRQEIFTAIRGVVTERFGPGVAAGMQPTQQIVAALVVDDRLADIEELARWEAGIRPVGRLDSLGWHDGALKVGFTAEYQVSDQPMTFRSEGGEDLLDPPLAEETLARIAGLGVSTLAPVERSKVDLVVRERSTAAEFFQPVEFTRERIPVGGDSAFRQELRATATVDPETAANGAPLGKGIWDIFVRISSCGWTKEARLGSTRADQVEDGRRGALSGPPHRVVLPYWTEPHGNLSLDVDLATSRIDRDVKVLAPKDVLVGGGRVELPIPVEADRTAESGAVALRFKAAGVAAVRTEGVLTARPKGAVLTADLPDGLLPGHTWDMGLGLPSARRGKPRWTPLPTALLIAADGTITTGAAGTPSVAPAVVQRPAAPKKKSSFPSRVAGRIKRGLFR